MAISPTFFKFIWQVASIFDQFYSIFNLNWPSLPFDHLTQFFDSIWPISDQFYSIFQSHLSIFDHFTQFFDLISPILPFLTILLNFRSHLTIFSILWSILLNFSISFVQFLTILVNFWFYLTNFFYFLIKLTQFFNLIWPFLDIFWSVSFVFFYHF